MRRIAILLSAVMLTLMTVAPASAQTDPYGNIPDTVGIECIVTVQATATTPGEVQCTVTGLLPGSTYTITITFPVLGASGAFTQVDGAAVAFVGAQSSGNTVTITGTVGTDGSATGSTAVPAGSDTSGPITASLAGTAADGSVAVASDTINEGAAPPATTAEETAATGAESGLLAIIALALVGAGAGAVLLARRRNTETVS